MKDRTLEEVLTAWGVCTGSAERDGVIWMLCVELEKLGRQAARLRSIIQPEVDEDLRRLVRWIEAFRTAIELLEKAGDDAE